MTVAPLAGVNRPSWIAAVLGSIRLAVTIGILFLPQSSTAANARSVLFGILTFGPSVGWLICLVVGAIAIAFGTLGFRQAKRLRTKGRMLSTIGPSGLRLQHCSPQPLLNRQVEMCSPEGERPDSDGGAVGAAR